MTVTNKRLVEILTTAMEKPEIANALIQRVINTLNRQEPQEAIDKWIKANTEHREWYICPKCSHQTPRWKDEWQGLTEYEVGFLTVFDGLHDVEVPLLANFIRHIEAKLKEKNT
jgi:hypothetical protein